MKKKKTKTLKNNLWKVFAQYIKLRDGATCFTCGKDIENPRAHHAGHFIPRAVGGMALYFHEDNVHSQCYHCNINLGGYGERYAEAMEEKYGREHVDNLRRLKYEIVKDFDYESKIEEYKTKLQDLQGGED